MERGKARERRKRAPRGKQRRGTARKSGKPQCIYYGTVAYYDSRSVLHTDQSSSNSPGIPAMKLLWDSDWHIRRGEASLVRGPAVLGFPRNWHAESGAKNRQRFLSRTDKRRAASSRPVLARIVGRSPGYSFHVNWWPWWWKKGDGGPASGPQRSFTP